MGSQGKGERNHRGNGEHKRNDHGAHEPEALQPPATATDRLGRRAALQAENTPDGREVKKMTRLEQIKIELKELIGKRDAERNAVLAQYTEDDRDAVMYATEMPAELTAEQQELKSKLAVIREKYSRIQQLAAEEARIENGIEDWNAYLEEPVDLSEYLSHGEEEQK